MKYDSSVYFHQFYHDWYRYNMHDDIVLSNTRLLKWPYYILLCYWKIPCRKNCILLQIVWNMNFYVNIYFICYWIKDNVWSRLGHWSLPVATMLSNLIGQKGATLLIGHYKRSNNKKTLDQQYTDPHGIIL